MMWLPPPRRRPGSRATWRVTGTGSPTVLYCTSLYCTVLYRFPYWFGRPDPRNAVLSADLRRFRRLHRFSVTNKCPFLYNLAYVTVNGSSFGAVRTCPETAGA